jgi:hypothetical protein
MPMVTDTAANGKMRRSFPMATQYFKMECRGESQPDALAREFAWPLANAVGCEVR